MKKAATFAYPTILVLDGTAREKINVAVIHNGEIAKVSRDARAQALPQTIAEMLAAQKLRASDIKAVAVLNFAQSLTGTRIAVTVTNSLAWLFTLPIIELPTDNFTAALRLLRKPEKLTISEQARVINEIVY